MKEINILKLQWGGAIDTPSLSSSAPAMTLNMMAGQNSQLQSVTAGGNVGVGGDLFRSMFKTDGGSSFANIFNNSKMGGGGLSKLGDSFGKSGSGSNASMAGIMSGGTKVLASLSGPKNEIAEGALSGANEIAGSFVGGPMGVAGKAVDSIGGAFNSKLRKSREGKAIEKGINTATTALMAVNPVLGLAAKGVHALVSGIDNWTGKKSDTITTDEEVLSSSSYTGSAEDIKYADSLEGKYGGLFGGGGRRRANRKIGEAKQTQGAIQDVLATAKDRKAIQASSTDMFNNRAQLQQSGVGRYGSISFGKKGMKFVNRYRDYLKNKENDVNLLPVGALHARKHNIKEVEGVETNKGIPVILEKGGKTVSQLAEIERNEIIFRKSVTDKLEELFKEGTDEAAIEAGKLLVREILYNTKDEGEFIKTVE